MPTVSRNKIKGPTQAVQKQRAAARRKVFEAAPAMELAFLAEIETARARMAVRERSRLVAKHGPRSPEVAQADRTVALRNDLAARLNGDVQRASIPKPTPAPDTLVVHGRAVDAAHAGVAKLEAALVGADGKVIARATTDEKGYFELERRLGPNTPPPSDPRDLMLVVSRGAEELYRAPAGDLKPGQAGYHEFQVKAGQ